MNQQIVNISQLQILLQQQVKEVWESEITQGHQVAHWLHNVPTQVVESAHKDEAKLANSDCASEPAQSISLAHWIYIDLS